MLSERQLEKILEVFRQRMQGAVEEYLKRMGEHLRDIGTLTASDINRLIELKRVNYNMEQVKRAVANAANASINDVDKVFEAIAESDARFASDVFAADHTPLIKGNPALERVLKAQAKITKQQLSNLSQTTLLSSGYKNAVDLAVQTVQSGITDYNSAIRKALKAAAAEGLRVHYPSGHTRRLDSAVRMNILDGVRAISQDILYQIGKEFDADGVELSAHALCAEDHVPYQGMQMPIKEFERLQNVILDRPFGMWNCRHTWHYIILGVSEPRNTPQELAEYKRNSRERITIDGVTKSRYEWTQEQRRIETAVRYQKDIAVAAKASGDIVARRECAYMIRELDKRYAEISKAAGLMEKPERMKVSGFKRVKAADELKNASESAKITPITKASGDGVNFVCKIDKKIYSCISDNLVTDEVIITDERIEHSNKHNNAYDKYGKHLQEALASPDYIFVDKMPNTGIVVKRVTEMNGKSLQIVLRVKVETDPDEYKNSIISCWDISESRLQNYLRNRQTLYKSK